MGRGGGTCSKVLGGENAPDNVSHLFHFCTDTTVYEL